LAIVAILIATGGLGLAIATRSEPLPQTRPLPVFRAEPVVASLRPVASFTTIADPQARSVALFEEAGRVIQHPRCLNCHPRTDRPTQTDAMRPHTHWVSRGPDNAGAPTLRCATCHNDANFDAAGVPGNSRWTLAPIEMAWQGRSLGEICRNCSTTWPTTNWSAGPGTPVPTVRRPRVRRRSSARSSRHG
jgi:hypothetical protein